MHNMADFLRDLIPWGMDVLVWIESTRTPLGNAFFKAITHLGSEQIIIVMVAVVYWSVSKPIGKGLAFCYLTSSFLNLNLKFAFKMLRPGEIPHVMGGPGPDIGSRIHPMLMEFTPSWPSNHAQGVAPSWGYIAWFLKKKWLWVVAVVLMILIGYSRLYLGVHFPQDVISGWLIGIIFTIAWIALEKWWREFLFKISLDLQVTALTLIPVIILYFRQLEGLDAVLGAFSGLGLGFILENRILKFDVSGSIWLRTGRIIAGLLLVFAILAGLKFCARGFLEAPVEPAASLVRAGIYCVTGFTASMGVPWIFTLTGLAKKGDISV